MQEIPDYLPQNQIAFLERLAKITNTDDEIFTFNLLIQIIDIVNKKTGNGEEVLRGAHIIINDPETYFEIIDNTDEIVRSSSHYSKTKLVERGININNSQILVGLSKINDSLKAWMQVERYKFDFSHGFCRGCGFLALHLLDYLKYKWTGENIGPCGRSAFVETNPIVLNDVYVIEHEENWLKHALESGIQQELMKKKISII